MAQNEVKVLDQTVQETNRWLREISELMNHPSRQMAYHALRGVLFAMRDRLPPSEAVQLAAQLPLLVRGIYFEGYSISGKPLKLNRDEFLERVAAELQTAGGANPEAATKAVIGVVESHVDEGEMEDVRSAFPKDLLTLWPERIPV